MKELAYILLCCIVITVCPNHYNLKFSRPVEFWSLKKLDASSDIVIIGTLSKTLPLNGTIPDDLRGNDVIGELLEFKVLYSLKGSPEDTLKVVNYRPKKLESYLATAWLFIAEKSLDSFADVRPKLTDASGIKSDNNAYMIFLRKDSSGKLSPVTGFPDARWSYVDLWLPIAK